MKKLAICSAFLLLFSVSGFSQMWKVDRKQIMLGIGASNFLGDLGGSDKIGTHGLKDLNISSTRIGFDLAYSYQLTQRFASKTSLILGWIGGDDAHTDNAVRNNRNLNFRSIIVELSGQIEMYLILPSAEFGSSYNVFNNSWHKNIPIGLYVFGGIGGFYFNPQAKYTDGNWYSLKPLSTEGQGLGGDGKSYSLFQVAIPVGIGLKYRINKNYSIGLEYGLRKTFTDYLDDVSTKYFDKNVLATRKGEMAAYFSNPSLTTDPGNPKYNWTAAGQQRGNSSYNDSYMFAFISLYYTFADKSHRFFRF